MQVRDTSEKSGSSLGYLNYSNTLLTLYQFKTSPVIELNADKSITLLPTTTILSRKDDLVWGMLSLRAFLTMYVYLDLMESQVVGDAQANVLRILLPRGQPGDLVAEEIRLPIYHRHRASVF